MSNPSASFIDSAKANKIARPGFRGVMAGVRLAGRRISKVASGSAVEREMPWPKVAGPRPLIEAGSPE